MNKIEKLKKQLENVKIKLKQALKELKILNDVNKKLTDDLLSVMFYAVKQDEEKKEQKK